MAKSEEELKDLLMRVKEESENAGLKLNIQKTKIMAFRPITSWQIEGEKVETAAHFIFLGSKVNETGADFIFLGSKITVDGDSKLKDTCSLEEKL